MIIVDSLDEAQSIYDSYAKGGAIKISWYTSYILVVTEAPVAETDE